MPKIEFKKYKFFILIFSFVLFAFILSANLYADSENDDNTAEGKKIIRVGWFDIMGDNTHGKDAEGNYSGYDYDFLMAIAQYTDWEYEFVEGDWSECYEWLKNGEIDIMGIVNKTPEREKIFDFAYTPAGTEFCHLYVPNGSNIAYEEFEKLDGVRIGVEKDTYQAKALRDYAKNNKFKYNEVVYDNIELATLALNRGEIDCFLASNTDFVNGFTKIAQFNPIPFYYAVKKGDTELLNELNSALNKVFTFNPNFGLEIYDKYFVKDLDESIVFTKEEKAFILSKPEVYIMYDAAWHPIEYLNEESGNCEGIVPDILKKVEDVSGLKFKLTADRNSVEVLKKIREEGGNAVTSISYDFEWAKKNNVKITQPFATCSIVRVSNRKKDEYKKVALVEIDYITENVKKYYPELEVIYYSDVNKCIQAVNEGQADCTFINSFQAEYYLKFPEYKKLVFNNINSFNQELCFGVSKYSNPVLFTILSKSLASITRSEIQKIVYDNNTKGVGFSIRYFIELYPIQTTLTAIIFISFVFTTFALLVRNKRMKEKRFLVDKASRDGLTGLLNPKSFRKAVESLLEKSGTYIIIDIDDFKEINDKHGHQVGDKVIIGVAELLQTLCRKTDLCARIGGDEFAIYLHELYDIHDLQLICDRIFMGLREFSIDGLESKLSLSIGCAITRGDKFYEELYNEADKAMYEIKNSQKNGYHIVGIK